MKGVTAARRQILLLVLAFSCFMVIKSHGSSPLRFWATPIMTWSPDKDLRRCVFVHGIPRKKTNIRTLRYYMLVVTVCGPLWLTVSHKPEIYHIVLCSVLVDWQETIDQSTLYHTTYVNKPSTQNTMVLSDWQQTPDYDASRSSLQYGRHSLWTILQFCVIFEDIVGGSMAWLNFKPTQMNLVQLHI